MIQLLAHLIREEHTKKKRKKNKVHKKWVAMDHSLQNQVYVNSALIRRRSSHLVAAFGKLFKTKFKILFLDFHSLVVLVEKIHSVDVE